MDISPNYTKDIVLSDTRKIESDIIQRTLNVALPFLYLHARTRKFASAIMTGHHIYTICDKRSLAQAAYALTNATLTFVKPDYAVYLSSLTRIVHALYERDKTAAAQFIREILYLVNNPAFQAAALLLQAALDTKTAYDEYQKGHKEGLFHLLLAAIRIYTGRELLDRGRREVLGRDIDETTLNHLLYDQPIDETIDVEKLLAKHNYRSRLQNIALTENTAVTNRCQFRHLRIRNCDFSGVGFQKSHFFDVAFTNTKLTDTIFIQSILHNVSFTRCDLSDTKWQESLLSNTHFANSNLSTAIFLNARATNTTIRRSTLVDTLLFGAAIDVDDSPITRTRRAIGFSFDYRGVGEFTARANKKVDDFGAISVWINALPGDIDPDKLNREVEHAIQRAQGAENIPQTILKNANSTGLIASIIARNQKLMQDLDGLFIPGLDEDIEPELYGAKRTPQTYTESDYRRSITELALLQAAGDKPIIGVCHGAQMINVFHGGTLKQQVAGHFYVEHTLPLNPDLPATAHKLLTKIMGTKITGLSMHHQAIDKLGKGLHLGLQVDNIPKMLINETGTTIASQIHIEEDPSIKGANFFRYLAGLPLLAT